MPGKVFYTKLFLGEEYQGDLSDIKSAGKHSSLGPHVHTENVYTIRRNVPPRPVKLGVDDSKIKKCWPLIFIIAKIYWIVQHYLPTPPKRLYMGRLT